MSDHRTTAASYAASGCAIFFGLTANEFSALVGAACAVATLGINLYYKHQQLKIAQRLEAEGVMAKEIAENG